MCHLPSDCSHQFHGPKCAVDSCEILMGVQQHFPTDDMALNAGENIKSGSKLIPKLVPIFCIELGSLMDLYKVYIL